MNKELRQIVYDSTNEIVVNSGYELADVVVTKQGNDKEITLCIYNEKGISFDDCEKVHNLVGPIIDNIAELNDEPYLLSISSLGLERPLKTTRDFERRMGQELEVKLYAPNESGKKKLEGVLTFVNEEEIKLQGEKEVISIERNKIANAVLKLDF